MAGPLQVLLTESVKLPPKAKINISPSSLAKRPNIQRKDFSAVPIYEPNQALSTPWKSPTPNNFLLTIHALLKNHPLKV